MGGGVAYFTDSKEVGMQYAAAMSKKTGTPFLYKVKLTFHRLFDVDQIYNGKELIDLVGKDGEKFARSANLLRFGTDTYKILSQLQKGDLNLTGEQVFKGMSQGGVLSGKARDNLIKLGYAGLRYNGGMNMGMATKHNVYLAYFAESIRIDQVTLLIKDKDKLKEMVFA